MLGRKRRVKKARIEVDSVSVALRQVYYGGTFIGNHVHNCCKVIMLKI